jgi:hypothetical protein
MSYSIPPLSARLFPRLARTQNPRLFVQMCSPAKAAPRLGWSGKSTIKKIVHYCADLCSDFAAGVFHLKKDETSVERMAFLRREAVIVRG